MAGHFMTTLLKTSQIPALWGNGGKEGCVSMRGGASACMETSGRRHEEQAGEISQQSLPPSAAATTGPPWKQSVFPELLLQTSVQAEKVRNSV